MASLWAGRAETGLASRISVEATARRLVDNVERALVGKRGAIELAVTALLCEGHLLVEDVPGTGKTTLARALAQSVGGTFRRLQCTPDLSPSDVTGVSVFDQRSGEFVFRPGPIFCNVLLVDEIDRATPRTQSAVLEAMQEAQVSADGVSRTLSRPFVVLATQNPVELGPGRMLWWSLSGLVPVLVALALWWRGGLLARSEVGARDVRTEFVIRQRTSDAWDCPAV